MDGNGEALDRAAQREFCAWQPEVMATFGGNDALFRRWWEYVTRLDPPDTAFVQEYSTNDRFLANRLILPEEVPFLVLPVLKAIRQDGYEVVLFVERAAHPYLWAIRRLARAFHVPVQVAPLRVKGLTRESFVCNLLTLVAADPEDAGLLSAPLTGPERDVVRRFLPAGAGPTSDSREAEALLEGTREETLRALADDGLDGRILIPNVLKAVVFEAGNRLRQGPLLARELEERIDPALLLLAPGAGAWVHTLVNDAAGPGGQITFAALLDGMNRCVCGLRRTLTHARYPALNALLVRTRSAQRLFARRRTLVIEEISVCGSTCLALEALGKAFDPTFAFDFGAVVGMWASSSFLDLAAASFFALKPLEDVPFLSPFCYSPVYGGEPVYTVKPHRFPSGAAQSPAIRYWERTTFAEVLGRLGTGVSEERARAVEAEVAAAAWARVGQGGLPEVCRRQTCDHDVLPALVSYYLGSFAPAGGQIQFRQDPILEARLESVLDSAGRRQKTFHREMDRFFARLVEAEERFPADVAAWRTAASAVREGTARRVARRAIQARERHEARMCRGLQAIARCCGAVAAYLSTPGEAKDGYKDLFALLQGAVP